MLLQDVGDRKLPLIHTKFSIFTTGTLNVPPLKIGPFDFADGGTFLMAATILFSALGVLMIMLRRSGYGQRLLAMKDSPAACATLGQNPVRLKLSVFMLSAAIAGVGGALMSSALVSVNSDRFSIFISLALVMTTVAAGMGSYASFKKAKVALALGVAVEGGIYLLAYTETISNWWFVGLTALMFLFWPAVGKVLQPGAFIPEEEMARRRAEIPLEVVGVDVPYTVEQRGVLDRALGLPAPPPTRRLAGLVPSQANGSANGHGAPIRELSPVTAEAPHGAA
jgi:hypothetical protein